MSIMAMTVLNNTATMVSLGELNKNISQVGKQLKKVASGQKINGAGDGASEYAVSERMRVRIRGLEQDIENTKTGSSMLRVAEGGVQNIIEELKSLRELAVNAANDHNTDADRAVLQKEFNQRKADIEDIATSTNYNGKLLLDGTYWKRTLTKDVKVLDDGGEGGSGSPTPVQVDVPKPYTPVSTGVIEPVDSPTVIPNSNYTITAGGTYVLPAGYSGKITIADDAKNVKITQANPSETLSDVYITGPSSGGANVWLENLHIKNTSDTSFVRFFGGNNVLTIKGSNEIDIGSAASPHEKAIINVGEGLTLEGSGDGALTVKHEGAAGGGTNSGAVIGSDHNASSNADIVINSGKYDLEGYGGGACIGSGSWGSVGNITINGGTFTESNVPATYSYGAYIGSGNGSGHSSGYDGASAGNITIRNATISTIYAFDGAIGSGYHAMAGNITVDNSFVETETLQGSGIGSGESGLVEDIAITKSIVYAHTNSAAEPVGKGVNGQMGNYTKDEESIVEKLPPGGSPYKILQVKYEEDNPLIIHTGTKANQALHCFIKDMRLDALGLGQDKETGTDKVKVVTRRDAEIALGAMVKENWNLLDPLYDDASEEEKNNPDNYIGPIDRALGYVLDQSTQLGAYLMELEYTATNLTTAHENTTASESTIRDADMAKEMTAYTKANVIAQASQSMLAQANQTASSVLSLLQ